MESCNCKVHFAYTETGTFRVGCITGFVWFMDSMSYFPITFVVLFNAPKSQVLNV